MMMIGGGASYALLGRQAPNKMELSPSATDAPHVETVRMFAAPIAPPEPDLIAAKLAPPPIVWPDASKPVVKGRRPEGAKMDAVKAGAAKPASTKPASTKSATAPKPKPGPKPNPKKQAAVNAAAAQ